MPCTAVLGAVGGRGACAVGLSVRRAEFAGLEPFLNTAGAGTKDPLLQVWPHPGT
jgi:hypothetical protein